MNILKLTGFNNRGMDYFGSILVTHLEQHVRRKGISTVCTEEAKTKVS